MAAQPITATSFPDYDSSGYGSTWTCDDWITWYNALLTVNTPTQANVTWEQYWEGQGFWTENYSFCKYDATFNTFANANGLNDAVNTLSDVISGGTKAVDNVTTAVVGVSATAANIANIAKYVVPALIVIGSILLVWWVWAKFIKKA